MKDNLLLNSSRNTICHTHPPNIEPGKNCWNLPAGEIHLWLTSIDCLSKLPLSATEQLTMSAIKHPLVASRFESTRKLLRYLFSAYLNCHEYCIEKTERGKPFLAEFPEFYFSVTHSKDKIMVALSRGAVGVDLEKMREIDAVAIAQRFFSPREMFFLEGESHSYYQETFFKLWTAKEAVLKADGNGIASGMKKSIATMEEGRVTSVLVEKQSWWISSWSLGTPPTIGNRSDSYPIDAPATSESSECFFGAVASSFVPTVIHWYDLRRFDKISA